MSSHPLSLFTAMVFASALHANDIQITNPTLTGTNTVNGTTQVQFDIIRSDLAILGG